VGGVGSVGGKSAFIHAAWVSPRPYPPHPLHPLHPLPKYSLATKNEQCPVSASPRLRVSASPSPRLPMSYPH